MKAGQEGSQILVRESYLQRIRGAVGTKMFQNLFVRVGRHKKDVLKNGRLSCALFTSTVLVAFHLIKEVHASVPSLLRDMESSGWVRIRRPKIGCIVVWENTTQEPGESGLHIGFYVGRGEAISNSSRARSPQVHSYKKQRVHSLYSHARLD